MAATNLPETLDPALKRPGRFDRQVAVPLPDVRGRAEILEYYLSDKPVQAGLDQALLARQTSGFSGADLNNLVSCWLRARRRGQGWLNGEGQRAEGGGKEGGKESRRGGRAGGRECVLHVSLVSTLGTLDQQLDGCTSSNRCQYVRVGVGPWLRPVIAVGAV